MGNFLYTQGQLTLLSVVRCGQNSNLSEILCMASLSASIKRIRSKTSEKRWRHQFPHYKSMGAFCCHGNQGFDPICPKTLCSLSPTLVMLHIKIDQDWPTALFKFERVDDNGPLVYYKLTLWAFGSGELKMLRLACMHVYPGNWRAQTYTKVLKWSQKMHTP